jgi:hypothetical protein
VSILLTIPHWLMSVLGTVFLVGAGVILGGVIITIILFWLLSKWAEDVMRGFWR